MFNPDRTATDVVIAKQDELIASLERTIELQKGIIKQQDIMIAAYKKIVEIDDKKARL